MLPVLGAKVALVLAGAALLALGTRRHPARLRAAVWGAGIAAGLAMPLLATLLPPVGVSLPAWALAAPAPQPAVPAPAAAAPMPAEVMPAGGAPSAVASAVSPTRRVPGWLALWLAGGLVAATRELMAGGALASLLRTARRLDDPRWRAAAARATARSGCRRRVRLLQSDRVPVPVTAGWLRPAVVLPAAATGWSDGHREVVLLHELVHVRRHDWLVRLAGRLLCTVHWFDPLAWLAATRLEAEQERAVDDEVVARGVPRPLYAAHLLATARGARRLGLLQAPALAATRRPRLEDRVMSILEPDPRPRRRATAAATAGALLLLVPVIAAVQPQPATAGSELSAAMAQMRRLESDLEPYTDRIHLLEQQMEPELAALENLEIGLDPEEIAAVEAEMAPYQERLEQIAREMAPVQARLEAVGDAIRDLELDRLSEIQTRLEPHLAELETLQQELEPYLARIEQVHAEMAPLHRHVEAIHRQAEPLQQHAKEVQARLEPFHDQLAAAQRDMAPALAKIERAADRVTAAITAEVSGALRTRLAGVTDPAAPYNEAAARLVDLGDVHVIDDELRIDADRAELRQLLTDLLAPHRIGTQSAFDAAVDTAADDLSRFRLRIP